VFFVNSGDKVNVEKTVTFAVGVPSIIVIRPHRILRNMLSRSSQKESMEDDKFLDVWIAYHFTGWGGSEVASMLLL